jgi:hypothetical protein
MTTLTYLAEPAIRSSARKAAAKWNGILFDLVVLKEFETTAPNILIHFGNIDRQKYPGRIAECRHHGPDKWEIVIAVGEKWATTWWQRFIGNGHNLYVTMIHEFGHVFGLPHSRDIAHAMHPEIGGSGSMSSAEMQSYREKFLLNMEGEV